MATWETARLRPPSTWHHEPYPTLRPAAIRLAGKRLRVRETTTHERRTRISAAVCDLHRAIAPLIEILDSRAKITMQFTVAGDTLTVSLKPGKPNDAP